MKKYNLTIVIVTFNSEKYIEKCIESISKSNIKKINYKIKIIDNNSSDGTSNIIEKIKNNKIFYINNKKNYGFAHAVNQGISEQEGDGYVLLLNPDTVLEKESLLNLIKCAEINNAGICGGTTIDDYGKESGSYFRKPNLMVGLFDFTNLRKLCKDDRWHKYFYFQKKDNGKKSFPVDVVTGGFMLIDKKTINKIGLFDESYFMYLEDVDYCLKASKAGIKIFHTNMSKIKHTGGASSNNKDKIRHTSWLKSRKIYFLKHFGILENIIIQPVFLFDDLLILIRKIIKNFAK
ncbi:MAG TPA: glycosyltransferase family 2 protein [Spirochaetia bacterium]|nr:glycosyltransferase family 2 protein [Spirochaetia bacterium]